MIYVTYKCFESEGKVRRYNLAYAGPSLEQGIKRARDKRSDARSDIIIELYGPDGKLLDKLVTKWADPIIDTNKFSQYKPSPTYPVTQNSFIAVVSEDAPQGGYNILTVTKNLETALSTPHTIKEGKVYIDFFRKGHLISQLSKRLPSNWTLEDLDKIEAFNGSMKKELIQRLEYLIKGFDLLSLKEESL